MNDAISVIQSVVRDSLKGFKTAELGVVTDVYSHESASDKNNYECDVRLRDSGLELKKVPVATQRVGLAAIPNTNDLVLIQYLHGDINSAVITARLYNDEDRAPEASPREFVYISPEKEEQGLRRLYCEFPKGNKLVMEDDKLVVEMGKTTLTINNDGDVAIDCQSNVSIKSKGDTSFNVKGNLDLKATGDVNIEGANLSCTGKASAKLDGGASTNVKGATVKVAGKIDFASA